MQKNKRQESGQVLLIVVLAMVITVVTVLAIASKSIVTIKDTQQQKQSQQAFSAAEAGVETALKQSATGTYQGTLPSGSTGVNVNFNAQITAAQSQEFILNSGQPISKDATSLSETNTIWMSTYSSTPSNNYGSPQLNPINFDIYWGQPGGDCTKDGAGGVPAIEVLVFTTSDGNTPGLNGFINVKPIQRLVFDPCDGALSGPSTQTNRKAANNFSTASLASTGIVSPGSNFTSIFAYRANITASGYGMFADVIPLYAPSEVGVHFISSLPGNVYPAQGKLISSIGTNGTITRKVQVSQGYSQIPNAFAQYLLLVPNP